jgi:hypothetical protein
MTHWIAIDVQPSAMIQVVSQLGYFKMKKNYLVLFVTH